jgi:hypothetical protein
MDPYEVEPERTVELYDGQKLVYEGTCTASDEEDGGFPEWYHATTCDYMFLGGSGNLWYTDPPNQQDWRSTLEFDGGIWFVKGLKEETLEERVRVYVGEGCGCTWKLVYEMV